MLRVNSLGAGWMERTLIAYSLRCHRGHEFEGWFRDSTAFDEQSGDGRLLCPSCDSTRIAKAVMAPAVSGTKKTVRPRGADARQMRQFATGLRKYVLENADYVGPNFAEEARKIHYGETPQRHIYGEATPKEAQELVEEGVDVAPLPPDPEAAN
jgi:hypothetical protein